MRETKKEKFSYVQGSGTYLKLSKDGSSVSIDPAGWMKNDGTFPGVTGGKVTWLQGKLIKKDIKGRSISYENRAIEYPDKAVSPTVVVSGCILVCRDLINMERRPNSNDSGIPMISIARVGIPKIAMENICLKAQLKLKDRVDMYKGYYWLTVKVKNDKENSPNPSYDDSKLSFVRMNVDGSFSDMSNWAQVMSQCAQSNLNMRACLGLNFRQSAAPDDNRSTNTAPKRTGNLSAVSGVDSGPNDSKLTLAATLESVYVLGTTDITQLPQAVMQANTCEGIDVGKEGIEAISKKMFGVSIEESDILDKGITLDVSRSRDVPVRSRDSHGGHTSGGTTPRHYDLGNDNMRGEYNLDDMDNDDVAREFDS